MDKDRIRLKAYLIVFSVLLLTGTIGFIFLENLSIVDSIYFLIKFCMFQTIGRTITSTKPIRD